MGIGNKLTTGALLVLGGGALGVGAIAIGSDLVSAFNAAAEYPVATKLTATILGAASGTIALTSLAARAYRHMELAAVIPIIIAIPMGAGLGGYGGYKAGDYLSTPRQVQQEQTMAKPAVPGIK